MNLTCVAAGFFVFSCTSEAPAPSAARYCQVQAQPFRYSRRDTPETREQLRAANAAWRDACAGAK